MNKIELNDNYVNDIITGLSKSFELKYQEDLNDNQWSIIIKNEDDQYFQGNVVQREDGLYSIVGDAEFNRVYPSIDSETGNIVK